MYIAKRHRIRETDHYFIQLISIGDYTLNHHLSQASRIASLSMIICHAAILQIGQQYPVGFGTSLGRHGL